MNQANPFRTTLLDVLNELDQIAPQIEFCAHGLASSEPTDTDGVCYILSGIAERIEKLSKLAYQAVRLAKDDGNPSEGPS